MFGLVCNGKMVLVPGIDVVNFVTEPKLGLLSKEDMRDRKTKWIRSIILHTTKGIWPQEVKAGLGPDTKLEDRIAKLWSTDAKNAGAHLSVDWDGTVCCHADLVTKATYHATVCNEVSIGIEIYQGQDGVLYEAQLDRVVELVQFLTSHFKIQRQMPRVGSTRVIGRMSSGGENVVGVYGHRHVTNNRGRGDPGDAIFQKLAEVGYEQFDFDGGEDLAVWKTRQRIYNLPEDGIPGPDTAARMQAAGYPAGLWVHD